MWSRNIVRSTEQKALHDEIINLPYYGGAKGQILQIRQKSDGTIESKILKQSESKSDQESRDSFYYNLYEIQRAANQLVKLQQEVKITGRLTSEGQKVYSDNLEKLGVSAQKLANIQREGTTLDFKLLFQELGTAIDDDIRREMTKHDEVIDKEKNYEKKESGATEKPNKKPFAGDSLIVNAPSEDASIAEAKPVGLAIAGKGGVASSRPVATAVVGDGGLAIANPVATAIAGISIEDADELGIPIQKKLDVPTKIIANYNLPPKGKYGLAESSIQSEIGLLVGPKYKTESRIADSEIQAEFYNKFANANKINNSDRNTQKQMSNDEEIMAELDEQNLTSPSVSDIVPANFATEFSSNENSQAYQSQGFQYPLAVAPEQFIPNQYPLTPPSFHPYLNFGRIPLTFNNLNPQQYNRYPNFENIPFDQSILQDRSINPIHKSYENLYEIDQHSPQPNPFPLPQYNPYHVFIY